MEGKERILTELKVPTKEINQKTIQAVMIATKKYGSTLEESSKLWCEIADILFQHLETGLNKGDDQLLCATCYFTVLALADTRDDHLSKIMDLIKEEIHLRKQHGTGTNRTSYAVSLVYGMFQSSFLIKACAYELTYIGAVLQASFQLLTIMAYEYSKYTFIVFKTLSLLKKVSNTSLSDCLFSKENQVKLLNIVNHNWENPVSGVRDLNKVIFQTLISTIEDTTFSILLEEINGFYWNKAKYLMLTEIINYSNFIDSHNTLLRTHWLDGLLSSLNKPGLVSAGTDMYFATLNKLKSQQEWCEIFMKPILEILDGKSKKAIDNFSNYWSITTFKTYPDLSSLLIDELIGKRCLGYSLGCVKKTEARLYKCLSIIKPANKLGLIDKHRNSKHYQSIKELILDALDHCNTQIRIMAFDVLCVSQNKIIPTEKRYDLTLTFLLDNMNSDCTVLRINMLNSFTYFLTQLNISYLNYIIHSQERDIFNLRIFCFKFQKWIISWFEIGGNYQRKITGIKLIHIFLNILNDVPKKKQTECNKSIIQMLKDVDLWILSTDNVLASIMKLLKDPAEDVRENVGKLLLEHYSTEIRKSNVLNVLIEDALKSVKSRFFYDISCGKCMFKLIINLLSKDPVEAVFKTVDDVYDFARIELICEYNLNTGILESINQGKQLHSFISILQAVFEVCHQNKYKINMSSESVTELLDVLQGISNQFVWEEDSSTSSDFSKMNDMLKDIILKSGYDSSMEKDSTKISDLEKIVLMCLWLNVKAACELSSLLIKYQTDNSRLDICERALGVISHVLETCRHKGAIEAAGAALGHAIQHLTSLPGHSEISKLPLSFLKNKLNELITEANKMASVTRRGAGLSIMVHRIVSSDMNREKPLFHYFMKTILETCDRTKDVPNLSVEGYKTSEKDLPKAIYIHFLTRIVTDSSLASDVMFYSAEMAELAFGNLANPHWQIRNAALQLYGALIQKLIGQKKLSGVENDIISTVGCDELRTHSPKLWSDILSELQKTNNHNTFQHHSNLVPILNMLGSLAPRYNFSYNITQEDRTFEHLLPHLLSVLSSPLHTVRRLATESIYNMYPFEAVLSFYERDAYKCENFLHGSLLLIAKYMKQCGTKESLVTIRQKYVEVFSNNKHSYWCKNTFEEIFCDGEPSIEALNDTIKILQSSNHVPGISLWANNRLQKYIKNADWEMIPEILKVILCCSDYETYCEYLLQKINIATDIGPSVKDIIDIFLQFEHKFHSGIIWKILYLIQIHTSSEVLEYLSFDITDVLKYLENNEISYKLRYMLPFVAQMSAFANEAKYLINIATTIECLIDPGFVDVEMRYIAALANNEVAENMQYYKEAGREATIPVIKSAIILLQDEDEEIRMLSARFYAILGNLPQILQPYICLSIMMQKPDIVELLDHSDIELLAKKLTDFMGKHSTSNTNEEYNPFANNTSNIYMEVGILRQGVDTWITRC